MNVNKKQLKAILKTIRQTKNPTLAEFSHVNRIYIHLIWTLETMASCYYNIMYIYNNAIAKISLGISYSHVIMNCQSMILRIHKISH